MNVTGMKSGAIIIQRTIGRHYNIFIIVQYRINFVVRRGTVTHDQTVPHVFNEVQITGGYGHKALKVNNSCHVYTRLLRSIIYVDSVT